jgi:hypothetical protein
LLLIALLPFAVLLAKQRAVNQIQLNPEEVNPLHNEEDIVKTAVPKTASPKTASPKTAAPKTAAPKTAAPKTAVRKKAVPKTASPKTAVPIETNKVDETGKQVKTDTRILGKWHWAEKHIDITYKKDGTFEWYWPAEELSNGKKRFYDYDYSHLVGYYVIVGESRILMQVEKYRDKSGKTHDYPLPGSTVGKEDFASDGKFYFKNKNRSVRFNFEQKNWGNWYLEKVK